MKLNTIPVGVWDGALVLLPPFQNGDEQPGEGIADATSR